MSHVGTGGYTFVPQREVQARNKSRGGLGKAHAHCAAFKHGWIVPVGHRHGAHRRDAVEDFEASVRRRAAQPRAALTCAVPPALDAYGDGDFGEPAPAYTRGFATLAVTPRDVSLRRTIPFVRIFDADWVPGQGPLHFGNTLARTKQWLVGHDILILEWEGKTSVWRPYTVVSWDATVFGFDNGTPSSLVEFGSHVISDSEDEQRVCLFNEVARLVDEHNEASDDEESDDEADSDYDIAKYMKDVQGPIEDHFKDANRESFFRIYQAHLNLYFASLSAAALRNLPVSSWGWKPEKSTFRPPTWFRNPHDAATRAYLCLCWLLDVTPWSMGTSISAVAWTDISDFHIFHAFDKYMRSLCEASATDEQQRQLKESRLPRQRRFRCPVCSEVSSSALTAQHISFSATFLGYACRSCDSVRAIRDTFGPSKAVAFSESLG